MTKVRRQTARDSKFQPKSQRNKINKGEKPKKAKRERRASNQLLLAARK